MGVTIKEVARAAGVSPAAVSKVLHGRGASIRVGEERARHIREVARSLDYHPNAIARSLRSSRTHTVGLLFENFGEIANGPLYYVHLLDGVASALFPRHYRLTVLPEVDHRDTVGCLADGRLDGVIWCKMARDEATRVLIRECPIPIVAMNAPAPAEPTEAVYVSCDNEGGVEIALDHLFELGHRRILFVREELEHDTPDCMARLDAFRAGMARRGAPVGDEDLATWDWDLNAFADWWRSDPPHTAAFCWSERAGARLLERAAEAGVAVPEALSVVGFDSTRFCEATTPRLTSVSQPISQMARFAGETLLGMIEGVRPPRSSITFPCGLDVRDSTARPRPRGRGPL